VSAKRTAKSSRPRKQPSQGRAKLAQLRRVTEAEIARSSPDELRDLPSDFWDAAVPVLPDDSVESLAARILVEEHRIYPEAIQRVLDGGWRLDGRRFIARA